MTNPTTTRPARHIVLVAAFLGLGVTPATGQDKAGEGKQPPPPKPTHADVRYGPHARNVLDLYLPAASNQPTPLVLYIHGGGFRGGDKKSLSPADAKAYLDAGFAVAALNYRLTDTAPMPAAYLDCARGLQFLRQHAKKWNLDPARVASTGGSAGAGTSLWLAFHDDLADPKSDDPVARQSTRLICVAVVNAQSSYDPRFAEAIGLPRPNFERHSFFFPFYGIKADEIDTPKAYKLYEEAAPITYLTKDDPPVLLTYSYADEKVTNQSNLGLVVHHPRFGIALKERMDKLGIECEVVYRDAATGRSVRHGGGDPTRAVDFVVKKLGAARQ
jgi:acetyl esterase/lipase